jgi:hypothetical protein
MTRSDLLVDSDAPYGKESDYVLDLPKQFNLPITRENYLGLAYPEGVPEDLDESGPLSLFPAVPTPQEIR